MTEAGGTVVVLAEADYRYGRGPLRLRVDDVDRAGAVDLDGERWVPVAGVQVREDGTPMAAVRVFVRAACISQSQLR